MSTNHTYLLHCHLLHCLFPHHSFTYKKWQSRSVYSDKNKEAQMLLNTWADGMRRMSKHQCIRPQDSGDGVAWARVFKHSFSSVPAFTRGFNKTGQTWMKKRDFYGRKIFVRACKTGRLLINSGRCFPVHHEQEFKEKPCASDGVARTRQIQLLPWQVHSLWSMINKCGLFVLFLKSVLIE